MNEQKQYRPLWSIIGALFLMNVGIILWILLPPGRHPPPAHRLLLERELAFDEKQQATYRTQREAHFEQTGAIRQEVQALRQQLYEQLKETQLDEKRIQTLTDQIGEKTAEMDRITFRHLREVRQLCTSAQQARFDQVIDRVIDQINQTGPPRRRPGPPPFELDEPNEIPPAYQ
jgi:periplasmic protein CpxP/Spy